MIKKLFAVLLGVVFSAMLVSSAFAEFVYATPHGKKYHHENSRFLVNKEVVKMTKEEAEEKGLMPSKDYLKYQESLQTDSSAKTKSTKK